MPLGCEFICKNEKCQDKEKGFVITDKWPLAKIELVIASLSKYVIIKQNLAPLISKLIEWKNEGRKYACITLPDPDNLPIEAYRVSMWSPLAKRIWQYDIEINGSESVEDAIKNSNIIPNSFPETACPLLDFTEVCKEGINCPSCSEKLFQSRWFTNESR